ncbi:MAG: PfkB family carbohydrate kinase [Chloroflexi bacterium]|nr:PfkB family carbohydrate kinase [Chloroflexota bacterium]MCY3939061.1 PfkB family carbohydrate kinase [Chloroflexota bacterium]
MSKAVPDYVCVGNFCLDEAPGGFTLGGTVSYGGRAAIELGATVGILTSGNPEDRERVEASLPGAQLCWVDSPKSMVFRNVYSTDGRRTQHLLSEASPLSIEHLPDGWESAPIVHLGPLAGEVSVDFVEAIGAQSLVGVTPQGWLRRRRADGLVESRAWEDYSEVLDRADALVFSEDDVPSEREASRYVSSARLAVVTRAAKGADVITDGRVARVPAFPAHAVDPTGAGDVFAAAFFLELRRSESPLEAARFAAAAAAFLIEKPGVDGLASEAEVRKRMSGDTGAG